MRTNVRSIEPARGGAGLEEYEIQAQDEPSPITRVARAVLADDFGPNGVRVRELLDRAATLTEPECRRLEEEAEWRWWPLAPVPAGSIAAARSAALVQGRMHGRAEAIVTLEAAVQDILLANPAAAARRSRLQACIANAGLAVLVDDLLDLETFDLLYAPWGAVLHR